MHPTIEQLMGTHAGELVALEVRDHVRNCTDCRQFLGELADLDKNLSGLRSYIPPADAWTKVVARLERDDVSPKRFRPIAVSVSLAASLLFVTVLLVFQGHLNSWLHEIPPPSEDSLAQVIAQSQYLEKALGSLDVNITGNDSRSAETVRILETRIASVDDAISAGSADTRDDKLQHLWKLRVLLLGTMLEIREAQAARASI